MGCKLSICVGIRVATKENAIHIGIATNFCFIVFPWEAFDFNINVEFLINLSR